MGKKNIFLIGLGTMLARDIGPKLISPNCISVGDSWDDITNMLDQHSDDSLDIQVWSDKGDGSLWPHIDNIKTLPGNNIIFLVFNYEDKLNIYKNKGKSMDIVNSMNEYIITHNITPIEINEGATTNITPEGIVTMDGIRNFDHLETKLYII
jgi:predicted DNA-binding protein YlxM (UPF0122 family)